MKKINNNLNKDLLRIINNSIQRIIFISITIFTNSQQIKITNFIQISPKKVPTLKMKLMI